MLVGLGRCVVLTPAGQASMQAGSSGVQMWLQVNLQPQGDAPARLVRQGSGPDISDSTLHLLGPSLATTNLALPGEPCPTRC